MNSRQNIIESTTQRLKTLGIYQAEFDTTIEIYASLVEQYERLENNFRNQDFKIIGQQNSKGGTNDDPILKAMEKLRKDILAYSTALGLTPSALKRIKAGIKEEKKKPISKLEEALGSIVL